MCYYEKLLEIGDEIPLDTKYALYAITSSKKIASIFETLKYLSWYEMFKEVCKCTTVRYFEREIEFVFCHKYTCKIWLLH